MLNTKKKRFVFYALILIAGILGLLFMGDNILIVAQSPDWPQTQGIILENSMEKHTRRGVDSFSLNLQYKYVVDEETYFGTRLRPMDEKKDRDTAWKLVNNYPAGKNVAVFYDPTNPTRSVLVPSPRDFSTAFFPSLFVLLILVYAIWNLLRMRTTPKKNKKSKLRSILRKHYRTITTTMGFIFGISFVLLFVFIFFSRPFGILSAGFMMLSAGMLTLYTSYLNHFKSIAMAVISIFSIIVGISLIVGFRFI
ncbi:TPA: DUF3592 domain-containing protein [Candidatus Woesearchaeota archaeon]|nr:hypothetical protein [archaeon]HIJ10933.1 DUF3592 domain-containing protein [Candidatus Woesearchaeota archaeon]|tara:strand:- start:1512 stop:2267 length:756 start_codon:yes stop_codon:yes gene_type:complete